MVSLSQPKVKPDAMKLSPGAGIHLPAFLLAPSVVLQGVCVTQQCRAPATHGHDTGGMDFPCRSSRTVVSGPIAGARMLPIDCRALHTLAGICHMRIKARWT